MSPNSIPSATTVWAIWGRMPEMMHSAPISRAATTVFSRCWATWVSTAGTPVMSMMAWAEPVSTSVWRSFSITTWVRAESKVPTNGTATIPSHSFTTGVDSSSISSAWRAMIWSRAWAYVSNVNSPKPSSSLEKAKKPAGATPPSMFFTCSSTASLSAKTDNAVSEGENP